VIDSITAGQIINAPASSLQMKHPGGELGKDEFLQLLVSQLRNQDPMNPSDPKDFAAQLAQFSSVEQLLNISEAIQAQSEMNNNLIGAVNSTTALGLIGKQVVVEGNTIDLPSQGNASVRIDVGGNGGTGEVILRDAAGVEVARVPLSRVDGGTQTLDLSGVVGTVPAGRYTYEVQVVDGTGSAVDVTQYARMRVEGLKYTPSGPVLMSGGVSLTLGQVVEISD
jgi:flagellar basal-body rod modification protein FlgD